MRRSSSKVLFRRPKSSSSKFHLFSVYVQSDQSVAINLLAYRFNSDRVILDHQLYLNILVTLFTIIFSVLLDIKTVPLRARFNAPNFNPTPQDLFHMVRQPTRQALYMAMVSYQLFNRYYISC